MGDVFLRKTTACLLLLVATLAIACVALAVLVNKSNWRQTDDVVEVISDKFQQSTAKPVNKEPPMSKSSTKLTMAETTTSPPPPPKEPWEADIRIPTTTNPIHYDLFLQPDLDTGWFTGRVTIQIEVLSPMKYLLTHVKEMNVTSTFLKVLNGKKVELMDYFEYKPHQFWVVRPKEMLKVGNYSLILEFNGNLEGHIVGFYKSQYKTKDGELRSIATSKFQPTDARRAFPCFDEPSFKSTYSTTLVRPTEGYVALSNMPVQYEVPDSPRTGLTRVVFQKSVPMVTYLACFIVCDFDYVESPTSANKPFRVYATKDQINRTHYARDIGVNILNYFEKYFETEYPLPKQDMIAIPDFVSGAMEHWGLITYRETNLLYDQMESSSYNKQRVAAVISHELAHMWFGNLVTLKWWDDLWLNEGFASYIEYKGVSQYEKEWDMMEQFVISDLQRVFNLDEILSSHPIVQEVNHPDEITEIFDAISYSKGASVLRMLEDFIGPEKFRMGVRNFLQAFKYQNAITQDLWDELQGVQTEYLNITRVMNTWTRQMGFPVVTVSISTEKPNHYELKQERFLINPDAKSADDSPFGYTWDIPLTFKTNLINRKLVWFYLHDDKMSLAKPEGTEWIKMNVNQYGYYRVNYDDTLWQNLISLLKVNHNALSASDRSSLIDDSFSLASAKRIDYTIPFQLISYLTNENHFIPWSSVYSHLMDIGELLSGTEAYVYYSKYVYNLVKDHAKRLGWKDEGNHLEKRNRLNILNLACHFGDTFCLDGARSLFINWLKDGTPIPANLRSIVYYYGIANGTPDEWHELLSRYVNEINAQEKLKLIYGLTGTRDVWVAKRFLNLAKNESIIRSQDYFGALVRLARNPMHLGTTWDYVRSEYPWMVERHTLNDRYLGRMIRSVGFHFTTPLELSELMEFFSQYPDAGSGKRGRIQAIEKIQQNIKWIKENAEYLRLWFMNVQNNIS